MAQTKLRKEQIDMIELMKKTYPIGSLYVNAGVTTNPATLFGFGTWESFGDGRCIVGKAGSGTFNTNGATGGAKTHTLLTTEMPSHTHTQNAHNHSYTSSSNQSDSTYVGRGPTLAGSRSTYTDVATGSTVTNQNEGSGSAHSNLAPYIVVHIWKRTA